jgi:hypothetical protein
LEEPAVSSFYPVDGGSGLLPLLVTTYKTTQCHYPEVLKLKNTRKMMYLHKIDPNHVCKQARRCHFWEIKIVEYMMVTDKMELAQDYPVAVVFGVAVLTCCYQRF